MSQAINTPTTPTRRSAIRFSAAALMAGLSTPVLAKGVKKPDPLPDADAELIRACDQMVAIEIEQCLLAEHDENSPDFGPNHSRYQQLIEDRDSLMEIIGGCESPTTPAGHRALARASLTWVDLDLEGNIACSHFGEEMMILLAKGIVPDFVWPPRAGDCETAHWAPPTSPEEIAARQAKHDAWIASARADAEAERQAEQAELRRRNTPSLMTDDELRGRFEGAQSIKAVGDKIYAGLEDEILRRMLA